MISKDNLSEAVRTAAAYELFLRLTSEKTSLMEAVFQKEVKHFLFSFEEKRKKHDKNSGKA